MYIDLLNQIKNAQKVNTQKIKYPFSKMDEAVLDTLVEDKYIAGFEKKGKNPKKYFEISLLYTNNLGAISGLKIYSKPSNRVYKKSTEIRRVKQGYGKAIFSTSSGIMDGDKARKENVGGQLLFTIW